MRALAHRLGLEARPEFAVGAIVLGLAVGWWCQTPPIGLTLGLGGFLLAGQILAQRREVGEGRDREDVRRIIEAAAPLARAGQPLDTALVRAARDVGGAGGATLAACVSASVAGRAVAPDALAAYPYSELIFQLWRVHREHGGDPAPFLSAYRTALGMSEDLAKKRQLALTQVRWQANVITAFFFVVLGLSLAHAGVFVSALLESPEGRWMTSLSACLVVWGRVVLNLLSRAMT